MRGRFVATSAILVTLVTVAHAPAWAGHGGIHPTLRTEHDYLTCATGSTGPTWSGEQPGGVLQGNGCTAVQPVDPYMAAVACTGIRVCWRPTRFRGTFGGNLRSLTIELHDLAPISAVGFGPDVDLTIDGTQIPLRSTGAPTGPEASSRTYLFSISELGCAREVLDEGGSISDVVTDGFVSESGPGSRIHHISLSIGGPYHEPTVWAWGAAEFASSITFNPAGEPPGELFVPEDPADCAQV